MGKYCAVPFFHNSEELRLHYNAKETVLTENLLLLPPPHHLLLIGAAVKIVFSSLPPETLTVNVKLVECYLSRVEFGTETTNLSTSPIMENDFPVWPLTDFRMWELCWTMPLVGGFSWEPPFSPALAFWRCSISTLYHPHRLSRSHYRSPNSLHFTPTQTQLKQHLLPISRLRNCTVRQINDTPVPEKLVLRDAAGGQHSAYKVATATRASWRGNRCVTSLPSRR
ncbi:hypothetical protein PR048_021566 [Dryococelus australis]|uniref:Uncharacterized protein n=1 Tax=Dryococelus australis TaxID=614101 RepID=A0ABQ9GYK0_9NEOP|nr:hypothetical protein PR048_021566 [Dryococelus australis]